MAISFYETLEFRGNRYAIELQFIHIIYMIYELGRYIFFRFSDYEVVTMDGIASL